LTDYSLFVDRWPERKRLFSLLKFVFKQKEIVTFLICILKKNNFCSVVRGVVELLHNYNFYKEAK